LEKIKQYPQHIFQFLTRYPEVYDRHIFPKNCWLGVTITREKDFERGIPYLFITSCNITFVSIEPILEYINPGPFSNANIDWVILGAETGKRKGKITPKKEWIENIVDYCKRAKIPIYLKDSLKNIYLEEIKEFPKMESIDARSK
jgi:protein gp37